MIFDKGDRVMTPLGGGVVVYRRMRAPSFDEVDVYSVQLDNKAMPWPFYAGTIFKV